MAKTVQDKVLENIGFKSMAKNLLVKAFMALKIDSLD
jgi:hypothetical protein